MDKKFFQELRSELEEKKKIADNLEEAIKFGEETNNKHPTARAELVAARLQIKVYEAALKKRGF